MLDQIQALRWFCDRQALDQSTTDAGNEMPASRRSNSRMVRPSVIVALALVLATACVLSGLGFLLAVT